MTISDEVSYFNSSIKFLDDIAVGLTSIEVKNATPQDLFLAEAIAFRLFRIFERFTRAVFLESCVVSTAPSGLPIVSKLQCADWKMAEEILKAGNRFLDWGNIENTRRLAGLVFENGFPVTDLFSPISATLSNLQTIRNFIAHDSDEARRKFTKVIGSYLPPSILVPDSAGKLLLARRNMRNKQVLGTIISDVKELTKIYGQL